MIVNQQNMYEEFIHYIWLHRLHKFPVYVLKTGEKLEILNPGELNTNAGPDFLNARIKIDNTVWAGNVEIHVNASDWYLHNHHANKNYNNIILHVVYNDDKDVERSDGQKIPTIEIKFYESIYKNYLKLKTPEKTIKCSHLLDKIDSFHMNFWIEKLAIERITSKAELINETLLRNNNNWEETFYQTLIRAFGFNINAYQFEKLASGLPNKILAKHKNNIVQLEALLFGQAGLLNNCKSDDYTLLLQREYGVLKTKFNLHALLADDWKLLRLRPVNFPSVRIAQIAGLIYKSNKLFSKILDANSIDEIKKYFKVNVSEYWQTHYMLGKNSGFKNKSIGKQCLNSILINAIIPLLFLYGQKKNDEKRFSNAIKMLEELPAEKNSIIEKWKEYGIQVSSAFHSQALIHLYNNYCKKSECLKCQIGHQVLTYSTKE